MRRASKAERTKRRDAKKKQRGRVLRVQSWLTPCTRANVKAAHSLSTIEREHYSLLVQGRTCPWRQVGRGRKKICIDLREPCSKHVAASSGARLRAHQPVVSQVRRGAGGAAPFPRGAPRPCPKRNTQKRESAAHTRLKNRIDRAG